MNHINPKRGIPRESEIYAAGITRFRPTTKRSGPSFADSVGDSGDTNTAAVTGSSPLSSIDALLPLQEISDQPEDKRRALQRGEEILDRLDDIRMGLLLGGIPRDRLKQLLDLVEQRRNSFRDPRLGELLDDIELRAKVELAKLGEL